MTSFEDKVFNLVGSEYTFLEPYTSLKKTPKLLCRHNVCGTEWVVPVKHFIGSGTRCPNCVKKQVRQRRAKTNETFVSEVHALVRDEYTFLEYYNGTDTKILCKHNTCGNEYLVTPYKFLNGRRCPECSKKDRGRLLRNSAEKFREQFDNLFSEYTLLTEYSTQDVKVQIRHNTCGKVFSRTPKLLLRNKTVCCDFCEIQSFGERVVHRYLIQHSLIYRREFRFEDCRNKKPLPFDFAILSADGGIRGLIEYDGKQHFEETGGYFGGERQLVERKYRDSIKTNYCRLRSIPLLRIKWGNTEQEIEQQLDSFINKIKGR